MSLSSEFNSMLQKAITALHERTFYAQYPEHPSPKIYGETADEEGRKKFQDSVGKKFEELNTEQPDAWIGGEESPYMQEPLNIQYPAFTVDTYIKKAKSSFDPWRKASSDQRAGVLIDSLERVKERFFELAYATMHTTGQGYMMAFQASGPHAMDRAMEAIAAGYEELTRFPEKAFWDKPMGKYNIQLNKTWKAVPKGIALAIGCSTFPTWNSVPGVYASLITGNPVIAKPHPGAILPMALVIAEVRNALRDAGLPVDACQMAVDTIEKPITKELAEHPDIKVIDYTGNSDFGSYLEDLKGKAVFTEKTGVNSVILDSAENLGKAAQNLAFSIALYSGQMCTAPQNFFIPEEGIDTPEGNVSFDAFAQMLVDNINGLVDNPKAGPFVLGTIQNPKTCDRILDAEKLKGKIWLKSREIENPMFKNARIATPLIMEVSSEDKELFSNELFGPIALLIKTKNTAESVSLAKQMAESHGAISCAAYTTDTDKIEMIGDQMSLAGTPVSFNLTGGIYVNQNAGFSDFHVTGGNPAGNASLTNPEYVIKRFTWVGQRVPV
jgi:phenylacetic acid degradation protein paaN